ncbi:sting [Carabus blaptoides fortunei]
MHPEIVSNEGNYNFPSTIPRKRGKNDIIAQWILAGVFETVGCLLTSQEIGSFILDSLTYWYLLLLALEYCQRTCDFFEEYRHLSSRYEGKIFKLLTATFKCKSRFIAWFAFAIMRAMQGNHTDYLQSGLVPIACSFAVNSFLCKVNRLESSPLRVAKLIDELKGLDYGSGMAHSFFHGYLNLILPCTGDERKGLKEQITDYEAQNNVQFLSKKLYILIPLSAHCPTSVVERSGIEMDSAKSLNYRRMDRAGVRDRHYQNSVYKIWIGKDFKRKPVYVCAEYATPLLTFYEVTKHNTPDSKVYLRHRNEIVTNFYMTLHKILKDDPDCRDVCELIYYRDIDTDGNPLSVDDLDVVTVNTFTIYVKLFIVGESQKTDLKACLTQILSPTEEVVATPSDGKPQPTRDETALYDGSAADRVDESTVVLLMRLS